MPPIPITVLRSATETVVPGTTGLWFENQTAECLAETILVFERQEDRFDPRAARRQALKFSLPRFERELADFVEGRLATRLAA